MRRRRIRHSGKMTVLYISIIVSLGAMGVGYAYWVSDLNLNASMSITTGKIDATYNLRERIYDLENVSFLDVNIDDTRLIIDGEVYPGFNHNFDIDIVDKGTVPVILKDIEEVDNKDEVAEVEKNKEPDNGFRTFGTFSRKDGSLHMSNSLVQDEIRDTINLSIVPKIEGKTSRSMSYDLMTISSYRTDIGDEVEENEEVLRLRNKIRELRQELYEYESMREDYNFKYNLLLEQDM